jgi:hypothetical protein
MQDVDAIHVTGKPLGSVRHICAFFHHKEEEYRALLDFIKEGIERNEKAVHIVDGRQHEAHRARLSREGIPVDAAERRGQLRITAWEETYLLDGYFDQERQIALLEEILQRGKREGYRLTRLVANMEWALQDKAGVADVVEYEARLNHMLPKYDDPVICTYDLSRFNAGIAMDMLRTHPLVILGGMLHENPLYVPPDEFLKELRARGA